MPDDSEVEFLHLLHRPGDNYATLSIVAEGKSYSFKVNLRRVSYLVQSGAETLREMADRPSRT